MERGERSLRGGAGHGAPDTVRRLLGELCARGPVAEGARAALREHVEEEARELPGDAFWRLMEALYDRVGALVDSPDALDNLGAVRAIQQLIALKLGEDATKISRFASSLRTIFEEKQDPDVLLAATAALGLLARTGGALTADVVEFQVKQALDWLHAPATPDSRRYAAVLILKEMAENAPTVFNVHVPMFIDVIWAALRDPKLHIRERACDALRACLQVIEKRETRWRVQGYYRMFEETQKGLVRNASVESIHGSLLAIGELLRNTGEFMMARYKEVADIVLKYRDHRERLVRRSITSLLPRIAHFLRDRFVSSYLKARVTLAASLAPLVCGLFHFPSRGTCGPSVSMSSCSLLECPLQICMEHLLGVMRNPAERTSGFVALGEMASAVGGALGPYLPHITALLRDALVPRRGRPSLEALACVGAVAAAVGPEFTSSARSLLDPCFAAGLSPTLVTSLSQMAASLPLLLPAIQARLLDTVAGILTKQSYRDAASSGRASHGHVPGGSFGTRISHGGSSPGGASSMPGDLTSTALTQLALRTLATFNLQGHELLEFVKETVVQYLDDDDPSTRQEAGICCCRLLEQSCAAAASHSLLAIQPSPSSIPSSPSSHLGTAAVGGPSSRVSQAGPISYGRRRLLVEEVVIRLLVAAVVDADSGVRKAILASFRPDVGFDDFLGQADNLGAIFIALNDEACEVRELAVVLAGRLASRNPAYVLPALRHYLLQLLTDLEHSTDNKHREESARLLGDLIRACTRLVQPYISPILKVLVAKLREGSASSTGGSGSGTSSVVASILATIGDLARVGGRAMRPYLGQLMPLIVEALQDGGAIGKREIAVTTLGLVVESTGYVVAPYSDYPQLLALLLRLLNGELAWSTRREVLKVLGIMGALDPHVHKRNLTALQAEALDTGGTLHGLQARSTGAAIAGGGGGGWGEAGAAGAGGGEAADALLLLPSGGLSPTSSEDYYPTVAIAALMRILREPAMSSYHQRVVGSLMYIFKSMGLACIPYLPKVMPDLFHVIRVCEEGLREFLFWQLAQLVNIVRQHIRKYLPELLALVYDYWSVLLLPTSTRSATASPVLNLVEALCRALNDEFRMYLGEVLPRCIQVLGDAERSNDYAYVPPVLHAFEVFNGSMEEHMQMLLPALVRLFKPGVTDAPLDVRRAVIYTLARLVAGYTSALLHPLMRVLDGSIEELRRDAVEAICALAVTSGADFVVFLPALRKLLRKHHIQHQRFESIAGVLQRRESHMPSDAMAVQPSLKQDLGAHNVGPFHYSGSTVFDPDPGDQLDGDGPDVAAAARNLKVNEGHLRKAWESSQRSTKEDWAEWMRHFSVELLKESPSPALRTCAGLAQLQPHVARELFAAGFVSCWTELNEGYQDQLVRSLEAAFASPNIPPEILATLLNLAEFMEHDEKPLRVDIRTLGALAEKCHAFAKALHYKEMEFEESPTTTVEALIHINNQLHQHEAAVGILVYAQQNLAVVLKESWYEKLQRWDEALAAYSRKAASATSPHAVLEATLGRMRCLAALARREELSVLCRESWAPAESAARLEMAPMAASAAWNMGEWDEMAEYVAVLDDGSSELTTLAGRMNLHTTSGHAGSSGGTGASDGAFFRAVLCVRRAQYAEGREYVERARKLLATELAALVLESYERAYSDMVRVQQLAELEEVIDYCTLPVGDPAAEDRAALIRQIWHDRIMGSQRNLEVWQALLAVRSLVLPAPEDAATWLKFASLCRKHGRVPQAEATLLKLLQYDPNTSDREREGPPAPPQVELAYLKHVWSLGGEANQCRAYDSLTELAARLDKETGASAYPNGLSTSPSLYLSPSGQSPSLSTSLLPLSAAARTVPLLARVHLKLGLWHWALHPALDDGNIREVGASLRAATEAARGWGKAWHKWALFNTAAMSHYMSSSDRGASKAALRHVVAAISGYFRSIALSAASPTCSGDDCLQDILRLLTLWFNHGAAPEVQAALRDGFGHVSVDTWLLVIPQMIARIHSQVAGVRSLIQGLLVQIGAHHPQALMYPLLVACKSMSNARRTAAQFVVDQVRHRSATLVQQAQLVSHELIRVAILWHELWHETLEEASRLFFGERNVEGMLQTLQPLHAMLDRAPETLKEIAFVQAYGHELQEANDCCLNYRRTGREADLTQAWDLYYHVFKRINKQLPSLTTLDLECVSPALVNARNLELAVPGTYRAGAPVITIAGFAPQLIVMTSKQRPRKCTIYGSDGLEYMFLLKGHEDLRQDERVMQLFGLVNTLLANARHTAEKDLSIQRYAVIPLSPNSGLIGWVPNCDTLHQLIRDYREARKAMLSSAHIQVNVEHRVMLNFAPDYEHLTLMAKVEVFEHALENAAGNDLAKVLWLKSRSSEVWLDRRTSYTRSLAVMSMVGYLLGLGDRHPSNLMLDRHSGKVIHIDFGDCFEASMNREKFPEKVPFRLTRMLVKAMEVSGIEGTFRFTCEDVMQVLRTNKDSVMAMMEAFVHDPLINWRLFNINDTPHATAGGAGGGGIRPASNDEHSNLPSPPQRGVRERELLQAVGQLGDANEVLNERAVAVMTRMSNKLTGRDFVPLGLQPSSQAGGSAGQAPTVGPASLGSGPPGPAVKRTSSMEQGSGGGGGGASGAAGREGEAGLGVPTQVQKLVAQATSHENLCQSYIGGPIQSHFSSTRPQVADGGSYIRLQHLAFHRTNATASKYKHSDTHTGLVQAVLFEVHDFGRKVFYSTSLRTYLCCTEALKSRNQCQELNEVIVNKSVDDKWPHVESYYFQGTELDLKVADTTFQIDKTGMYFLWFVTCDRNLYEDLTISGLSTWKNPGGFLPGMKVPLLSFYALMSLAYLLLGVLWLLQYARYWKDILQLQNCISAVLALGMMEMTMWYFDYENFNQTGKRPVGITIWAVTLGAIRKTVSHMLVLVVSMGFGVVRPTLGGLSMQVILFGATYFVATEVLEVWEHVGTISDLYKLEKAFLVLPESVLEAIFILWIFTSLSKTLAQLQARRQVAKLDLYRRFTNALAIGVLVAVAWIGYEIYTSRFDPLGAWERLEIITHFWDVLSFLLLVTICVLWAPSQNSTRYAYSEDVPDDGADEEAVALTTSAGGGGGKTFEGDEKPPKEQRGAAVNTDVFSLDDDAAIEEGKLD
eukprot:SM000072S21238  [mRNA]  locus=s72:583526:601430:+ [translate_table: standard]